MVRTSGGDSESTQTEAAEQIDVRVSPVGGGLLGPRRCFPIRRVGRAEHPGST